MPVFQIGGCFLPAFSAQACDFLAHGVRFTVKTNSKNRLIFVCLSTLQAKTPNSLVAWFQNHSLRIRQNVEIGIDQPVSGCLQGWHQSAWFGFFRHGSA